LFHRHVGPAGQLSFSLTFSPSSALSRDEPWGARGRGDSSAGPMAAAPSLQRWCRGWPPRAPERNPRCPLPRPPNPRAPPYKAAPAGSSLCAVPPPWGFPLSPPPPPKIRRGEGVGGRKEAQEAGEKLGAAMVRGLRRRARATMSPFVKEKTEGEGGRRRSRSGVS
jgi:hypothetical protein